jgi:hypothetical protein
VSVGTAAPANGSRWTAPTQHESFCLGTRSRARRSTWSGTRWHSAYPKLKKPEVALVTAGVEMDVLGLGFAEFGEGQRQQIVAAHPRGDHFKERIIQAFFNGIKHKPELLLPTSRRTCSSAWNPTTSGLTFVMSSTNQRGLSDTVRLAANGYCLRILNALLATINSRLNSEPCLYSSGPLKSDGVRTTLDCIRGTLKCRTTQK